MSNFTIPQQLRETTHQAYDQLLKISPAAYQKKPTPNKWSAKEIMGHLIDSAANNHQRFVRAQMQDNLIFQGYQQDNWVKVQDYQNTDWIEVLDLWKAYNLHLARVIENIPEETLFKQHTEHAFDLIAWKTVPRGEPTTLAYFIEDYLGHLKMHLGQVEERIS